MKIEVPDYLFDKDADIRVMPDYDHKFHLAFELGDRILVVEYIPENWPSVSIVVFDGWQKYWEAIREVDWILENMSDNEWKILKEKVGSNVEDVRQMYADRLK